VSAARSPLAAALAAEADGPAAPPRSNGELVFAAPWESRAFGLAVSLAESRTCDWEEFRSRLIAEIARWQEASAGEGDARWSYYERWLEALQELVVDAGLVSADEIEARAAAIEHEDAHDHDHDHDD
jgi:nitrile hydratase accessory protein